MNNWHWFEVDLAPWAKVLPLSLCHTAFRLMCEVRGGAGAERTLSTVADWQERLAELIVGVVAPIRVSSDKRVKKGCREEANLRGPPG